MPRPSIIAGIDIGTYEVKVLIASSADSRGLPTVLGSGAAESKGLRHGYIINSHDAVRSVKAALAEAQKNSGERIRRVYMSFGGAGLESFTASGTAVVSRADLEVGESDIENALQAAENALPQAIVLNRKILHVIPLSSKLDGKEVIGRPLGMKGAKLEIKALFITALEQHLNDMIQAVEEAGLLVLDVMAAPLAVSLGTLSNAEKLAGCVLANIGADTVSVTVFENNIPISLQVFPFGSADITRDIALGFQIPIEEAEDVKLGVVTRQEYPAKKIEEIVSARLSDIFELVESHLRKLGRGGLLPGGIILTGGGSGIASIEDFAKAALRLPVRIAFPKISRTAGIELGDSFWSVAYGLCIWGSQSGEEESMGIRLARRTKNKAVEWLKQFLP